MKIGFIGTGNIGSSIIKGLIRSGINSHDLYVYGVRVNQKLVDEYSLTVVQEYAGFSDCSVVVVAIGGPDTKQVLLDLGKEYQGIILSTGSGDLQEINERTPETVSFAKIVPNTPVQICEGITAVSFIKNEKPENMAKVKEIFEKLGDVYVVSQDLLGIYGTVGGCTPAYVDQMIEALSDAAVENGIKRTQAYKIIEKMILGTAKLALESEKLPEELKDEVTTPGGSTIRGVNMLEKSGFRAALIKAVNASAN